MNTTFDLSEMNATFPNSTGNDTSPNIFPMGIFKVTTDLLNVLGNIIVAILISKDNKHKTTSGKLLINQAAADGVIALMFVALFVYETYLQKDDNSRPIIRTIFRVIIVVLYSESLQVLGGTALILYISICHPLPFKIYNRTSTVAVFIASTWTINIIVGCLVTVDGAFVHDDPMFFSIYRLHLSEVWYGILKLVVMFLLPLMSVFSFIKIWIFKRNMNGVGIQSGTMELIKQAWGVLLLMSLYAFCFMVQITLENLKPIRSYDGFNFGIVGALLVYLYLVLKLPLFLLAFKPYRKVAKGLFCRCLSQKLVQSLPRRYDEDINQREVFDLKYFTSVPLI